MLRTSRSVAAEVPDKAGSSRRGSARGVNPQTGDGPDAFVGYVHWLRGQVPELHLDIKRTIAEGDLVVTHSNLHLAPGDRGMAVADFWRLDGGRIVEHWDVIQEVPEEAANTNTMF
ncbi:nuclear transport factor 2 family protein [Curtobacterium pusillum]|uniref:nuclear transport factor 2 family protein n=1 Tax=Curtobacterium pusillum TaxID=69373 RepID=UPI0011A8ED14|nr:nuclear transport factor 2 family protein [Curtobacterium pusillum]